MSKNAIKILFVGAIAAFFGIQGIGGLYFGIREFEDSNNFFIIKGVLSDAPDCHSQGRFNEISDFQINNYPKAIFRLNCVNVANFCDLRKGDSISMKIRAHFEARLLTPAKNDAIQDFFLKIDGDNILVCELFSGDTEFASLDNYKHNLLIEQILFGSLYLIVAIVFSFLILTGKVKNW